MSCQDKKEAHEDSERNVEKASVASDRARRKLENRLKSAGVACTVGAFGVLAGVAGILAGGSACLGALLVADDAAADYEEAVRLHEIAEQERLADFMRYFICMRRHEIAEDAIS